jgi:hypothetical protein
VGARARAARRSYQDVVTRHGQAGAALQSGTFQRPLFFFLILYTLGFCFADGVFPLLSFLFQYRAKGKPLPLARRSNMLKKTQKLPF